MPQLMQSNKQLRVLEWFVILMYNQTTRHEDVNKALQFIFSQGTRSIESIPPGQAAIE